MKKILVFSILSFCFLDSFAQSLQIVFLTDAPLIVDAKEYFLNDIFEVSDDTILYLKKKQAGRLVNINTGEQYPLYNDSNVVKKTKMRDWVSTNGMFIRGNNGTQWGSQKPILLDTLVFKIDTYDTGMRLQYQTVSGKDRMVKIRANKNHVVSIARSDLPKVILGNNTFTIKKGRKEIMTFQVFIPNIDE